MEKLSTVHRPLSDPRPLPEGWEWTTLGESCDIVLGQSPSSDTYNADGNGLPFYQGKAEFGDLYPTPEKWCSSPKKIAEENDILITVRAPVGPTNLCPEKSCIGRGLAAIRPRNGMPTKFFLYFLRYIEKEWDSKATGTTFKAITGDVLRNQEIPLPPLPEQERIVARLEELLSDLDAGVAALERVRAGVKRYKASVLKAACEGKLFGDKGIVNGELPEGWRWATVGEIAETIGGVTKGRHFGDKKTVSLPYLRVANVQRGQLDLSEMKEIELLENEIEKYRLREGDVVLTEGGDWDKLGRSAIWKGQIELCVHQNHIFRARVCTDQVLSEWLLYYTNSEQGQKYFSDSSKQTTNLASINLTQLRSCPIPLPPLEEQRRIVAEVERRLESARAVESAVEVGLKRAGRLRQAVLRSAFEGKLS